MSAYLTGPEVGCSDGFQVSQTPLHCWVVSMKVGLRGQLGVNFSVSAVLMNYDIDDGGKIDGE